MTGGDGVRTLAEFELPSVLGNEKEAIARVARAVRELDLPTPQLERLKTAVGEATMNAIEHGNHQQAEVPVAIRVSATTHELIVAVTDHGGDPMIREPEKPDLEKKLEGVQSPRGWGLFLVKNMVDDLRVTGDEHHHTVELILHRIILGRGPERDGNG